MPALLSLQSINETLDNLELKEGTLKAELVRVLRSYFVDEHSVQAISNIPADEIVLKIWGPCQGDELKAKKKSFSSLKSALNKSLKDLDKAGKNQAGIILGRDNVFIVSEERKDDILKQMGLSPNSPNLLHDMFAAFKKFFSENIKDQRSQEVKNLLDEFEKLRQLAAAAPDTGEETETVETIELDAGEEFELLDQSEEFEVLEGEEIEEVSHGEPEATEFLDEDVIEEIQEIAGEDLADNELLEEEMEILDEAELEEVPAEEIAPGVGLGEEEGTPGDEELAEEVEILDEDLVEEIQEIAGEDLADNELLEEEVEILDEAELEEVPAEEIPPGEGLGEEEGPPGDEELTEEVEILDEDLIEEVQGIAGEELADNELLEEEVEILDEAELEEVPAEEIAPGEGLGEEEGTTGDEELAEEVELLDEDQLEEVQELADEDLVDNQLLDEELVEEVQEIVDEDLTDSEFLDEEVEFLDQVELEEMEESAASMDAPAKQPSPLEVLSKYIEAEEAVSQGELLRETQEEFINQILERFMPKFIKIPAGIYLVGSATPKGLEQPLRKVSLQDFYLGQSPVTNDLFDMFVRETGYTTDAEEAGYGIVFEGRCTNRKDPQTGRQIFSLTPGTLARHVSGANWRRPAGPDSNLEGKHNHPVVQVSHHDAMAFAAWAGKRLPTEEEWEAAARGKNGLLFPWGEAWKDDFGNFEGACLGGTTSIEHFGRKGMSPFGIYDLLGNVAEWTASLDPGQLASPGKPTEKIYILKGGSWITGGTVTAAWRQIERGKYWTNTIGFRCAV